MEWAMVVGGPHAGQWHQIDPSYKSWEIAIWPKMAVSISPIVPSEEMVTIRREVYYVEIFRIDTEWTYLLCHPSLNLKQAWSELLRGYARLHALQAEAEDLGLLP